MIGAYLHGKLFKQDHSWMGYKAYKYEFSPEARKGVWVRSLYGFGSFFTSMMSIYLMPVSVSVSLTMTATFFTPLIAWIIEREIISLKEAATILVGFIGVLMIVNPRWFNHPQSIHHRETKDHKEYPYYYLGVFFGLLFAYMSAMFFITTRRVTSNMYVSLKSYYLGVMGSVASLCTCLVMSP